MTKRKPVRLGPRAVAPVLAVALLSGGATARPQEVDVNYDFEAGERVIVSEDYAGDNVGDFPRGLEFRSGNIAVVDVDGRRALQLLGPCEFDVPLAFVTPAFDAKPGGRCRSGTPTQRSHHTRRALLP